MVFFVVVTTIKFIVARRLSKIPNYAPLSLVILWTPVTPLFCIHYTICARQLLVVSTSFSGQPAYLHPFLHHHYSCFRRLLFTIITYLSDFFSPRYLQNETLTFGRNCLNCWHPSFRKTTSPEQSSGRKAEYYCASDGWSGFAHGLAELYALIEEAYYGPRDIL